MSIVGISLLVSTLILDIAVAVALVRKYIRTRDVGFVWLGVAVLVWPLVSFALRQWESFVVSQQMHGKPLRVYPFSLVEHGHTTLGGLIVRLNQLDQFVGALLVLVAVLSLSRPKRNRAASV